MEDKYLTLLLLLFPGFITDSVCNSLTVYRSGNTFDRIVRALVFSIINYMIIKWLYGLFDIDYLVSSLSINDILNPNGVLALILIESCIMGIILAVLNNYDILHKLARYFRLTSRTGRDDLWQDIFLDYKGEIWVRVIFEDGTIITGFPDYYSDNQDRRELFLGKAEIVPKGNTNEKRELYGPGVYVDCSKIKIMEFDYGEGIQVSNKNDTPNCKNTTGKEDQSRGVKPKTTRPPIPVKPKQEENANEKDKQE